ncbi:hypothetical protein MBCUT_09170 [Methanobrevibacter cuticularis]|uniref:Uncharacterized protein n=1 Tax=Methanobrevibacter cuticularis TaxID=47311 RepID=A0A166E5L9_9EURY|nr:hypothetical protein [Methanobrevibacter cuticularis]KZX16304.1 hypothetical protein MBCUT_09170 [Methanobrevibacter cuticularis]
MSEIDENIIFKKDSNEELDIAQKFVGLKLRQEGILTVNFRSPKEEMDEIKKFFDGLKASEHLIYNIGNTGDVSCYFKGVAPLLEQTDDTGFNYFFLSVTLQELNEISDDVVTSHFGCNL